MFLLFSCWYTSAVPEPVKLLPFLSFKSTRSNVAVTVCIILRTLFVVPRSDAVILVLLLGVNVQSSGEFETLTSVCLTSPCCAHTVTFVACA